jgi:hypothetical protein
LFWPWAGDHDEEEEFHVGQMARVAEKRERGLREVWNQWGTEDANQWRPRAVSGRHADDDEEEDDDWWFRDGAFLRPDHIRT